MKVKIWHEHHTNNIDQNPIDEIYTILAYNDDEGFCKKFSIKFQYEVDENFCTRTTDYKNAKFFNVFVSNGIKASPKHEKDGHSVYSGYYFEDYDTLLYTTDSLDSAKRYIEEFQLAFYLSGYLESHIHDEKEVKEIINKRQLV